MFLCCCGLYVVLLCVVVELTADLLIGGNFQSGGISRDEPSSQTSMQARNVPCPSAPVQLNMVCLHTSPKANIIPTPQHPQHPPQPTQHAHNTPVFLFKGCCCRLAIHCSDGRSAGSNQHHHTNMEQHRQRVRTNESCASHTGRGNCFFFISLCF